MKNDGDNIDSFSLKLIKVSNLVPPLLPSTTTTTTTTSSNGRLNFDDDTFANPNYISINE